VNIADIAVDSLFPYHRSRSTRRYRRRDIIWESGSIRTTMPTAADFRNFAQTCAQIANKIEALDNKAALLTMAEKWTGLAEEADRTRRLVRDADAALDGSNPETGKLRVRRRFS
jgi:hypothetical protein